MIPPDGRGHDRRDITRSEVDLAVDMFGTAHDWTDRQRKKARRIAYRAVWTESDFWNYSNVSVAGSSDILPNDGPPSHGGDLDSVGVLQQRAAWWGSLLGSMQPLIATWRFLTRMLVNAPGWLDFDESIACQTVQQSQYDGRTIDPATGQPYTYALNYRDREDQTNALELDPLYFAHHGTSGG